MRSDVGGRASGTSLRPRRCGLGWGRSAEVDEIDWAVELAEQGGDVMIDARAVGGGEDDVERMDRVIAFEDDCIGAVEVQ